MLSRLFVRLKIKLTLKKNLKVSYEFSEEQAEAIVTLQLYRLTNTDIVTLENEEAELRERITMLKSHYRR